MDKLTCCRSPKLDSHFTDLGHMDSFEFMLGQCIHCGAYWMDIFCVASNTSGYEQVSDDDARIMLTTPSGPELKSYIKAWFREH
jgi:hypothetical protein